MLTNIVQIVFLLIILNPNVTVKIFVFAAKETSQTYTSFHADDENTTVLKEASP